MTPAAIIKGARADGLRVSLSSAGTTISVRGDPAAVTRWAPALRTHKPEIIEALKVGADEAADATPPPPALPWPAELAADLRRVADAFEWTRQDVADFVRWARQSPKAMADATAFLHGELSRLPPPEPPDVAWCREALAADPTLRVVWKCADDGASEAVRVVIAIRGKGVGVVAIPRGRFEVWAMERMIGDMVEQQGGGA